MVGVWTSQDKKKTKALEPKGSVGRFLTCDTWWTGVTEIVTTDEDGDSVIVRGLKLLRAEPDMVKLSQPVPIPPGWSDLAVQALASLWTVILLPLDDEVADEPHAELAQTTSEQKVASEETSISEETSNSEETSGSEENGHSEEPLIASRQDTLPSASWSTSAQPSLPTTKKPKKPKKTQKKSDSSQLPHVPPETREECLDFTPPQSTSQPQLRRETQAKAEPVTSKEVMASRGEEYVSWLRSVKKEFSGFVNKEALRDATDLEKKMSKRPLPCTMVFVESLVASLRGSGNFQENFYEDTSTTNADAHL
eukprot:5764235-Amphidinium_carterae.4